MLPAPDSQEIRLQELIAKREPLWQQFKNNPTDTHLALHLKIIDDQISDCNQQIRRDRKELK
jgi:hypothetical protein